MSDWVARTPVKSGALETRGCDAEHNGKRRKFQEEPDRAGGPAGMATRDGLTPGLPTYELTAFACNAGSKIVKYAATDSR